MGDDGAERDEKRGAAGEAEKDCRIDEHCFTRTSVIGRTGEKRGLPWRQLQDRFFEREARPDVLSGTPRAHAIDRWIYRVHGGVVHRHRAGRVHPGCDDEGRGW